jgi:hypothetical protein
VDDAAEGAFDEDSESESDSADSAAWNEVGGGWELPATAEVAEATDISGFMVSSNGNSVACLLESIAWSFKRVDTQLREAEERRTVRDEAIVGLLGSIATALKRA